MNTISELIEWGTLELGTSAQAPFEAKMLLANSIQCDESFLFNNPDAIVSNENIETYQSFIARRKLNEPLSYIVGNKVFFSLKFDVSSDTLIPRMQTELLVKIALENLSGPKEILDLGTGCGTIGCTLAYLNPNWKVTCTDVCEKALNVAKSNAEKLQLKNVEFIASNWFDALEGRTFDAIVSNPPYLRTNQVEMLFGKDHFEPPVSLSAGPTGYEAFRIILDNCAPHLNDGGLLILEHGLDQADNLHALLSKHFESIQTVYDSSGNARVTFGCKKS